jgi:hypothetical protein
VRDLIATELEEVDGVHPWRAVVADEVFDHRQVIAVGDPAGVEREVSRVLATPLPKVRNAFEPLTGLGKLEHSVVVIDLVSDVLVSARIVPVAFESEHEVFLVEHHSPPGIGGPNLAMEILGDEDGGAAWPGATDDDHGGVAAEGPAAMSSGRVAGLF